MFNEQTLNTATGDADTRIFALFQKYCDHLRGAAECSSQDDARADQLAREAYGSVAEEIARLPSTTAAALAIKVYVALRHDDDEATADEAALSPAGANLNLSEAFQAGLLRDLVRLMPDLGPLCAARLAHIGSVDAERAAR
jgi:hypothetical protein